MKVRYSVKNKILTISLLVLIVSNVALGLIGYFTAKNQLNEKGEIILENAVESALQIIDIAQKNVDKGAYSLEESQEMVKEYFLGVMNQDGTRSIDSPLDLGESGYIVVYSQEGDEIAHPTLEGDNVWDVEDKAGTGNLLVQDSINMAKAGGGFTYYDWFLPNSETIGRKIVYNKLDPNWGWVVTAGSYESDFNQGAVNVLKYTSVAILFFIALVVGVMHSFTNKIGKALVNVTERANRIANLDIRDSVSETLAERNDEIGLLSNSFQKIIENLKSFIEQISNISNHLAQSSKELSISSDESANASNEVAITIGQIAQGATDQAMDTEVGAKEIDNLGNLVETNQEYISQLNASTVEVGKLKDEGFQIIEELMKNTKSSNVAIDHIKTVINETNESAEKIEAGSNMIISIAEQTNLLALNAAIEAARAGESGRGFAVVAEEIRKLAEQSNGFAADITQVVMELNRKTEQAVVTAEGVAEITESQNESVIQTNNKFIGISDAIENMNKSIELINKSGEEMIDMSKTIIGIIHNLSAISEENAAGTEEVSAAIEEQTAAMAEVANASDILADLAREMQESISKFQY